MPGAAPPSSATRPCPTSKSISSIHHPIPLHSHPIQEYRALQSKPRTELTADDQKRVQELEAQIKAAEARLEEQRAAVEEQRRRVRAVGRAAPLLGGGLGRGARGRAGGRPCFGV